MNTGDLTLNQVIQTLGWRTEPAQEQYAKKIFNHTNQLVGKFTADEFWKFIKNNKGDLYSRYKNPGHKPGMPEYGPAFYQTNANPDHYRGYLIYNRTPAVWDIVKDGVCVGQHAGLNGARRRIDSLMMEA